MDAIHQRVSLVLEYPVVFTRDLLAVDSTVLVDVLGSREPARRHRAAVIVDAGVAGAWPELLRSLEAYAERHAARLDLAAVWTVPGGEAAKTAQVLDDIVRRLAELAIDRHSFVPGVGNRAGV